MQSMYPDIIIEETKDEIRNETIRETKEIREEIEVSFWDNIFSDFIMILSATTEALNKIEQVLELWFKKKAREHYSIENFSDKWNAPFFLLENEDFDKFLISFETIYRRKEVIKTFGFSESSNNLNTQSNKRKTI